MSYGVYFVSGYKQVITTVRKWYNMRIDAYLQNKVHVIRINLVQAREA